MSKTSKHELGPEDVETVSALMATLTMCLWRMNAAIRHGEHVNLAETDTVFEMLTDSGIEASDITVELMSDLEDILKGKLGVGSKFGDEYATCFKGYREKSRAETYQSRMEAKS